MSEEKIEKLRVTKHQFSTFLVSRYESLFRFLSSFLPFDPQLKINPVLTAAAARLGTARCGADKGECNQLALTD